jgi:transmembrane sensor
MTPAELQSLLEQYMDDAISEQDFRRLWRTLAEDDRNKDWLAAIENAIASKGRTGLSDPRKAMQALADIKAQISYENKLDNNIRWLNNKVLKIAASFVLIAGAAIFVLTASKTKRETSTAKVINIPINDVKPASGKATLTLADGSTIDLENAGNGSIARQGNAQVIKLSNGELQYKVVNNSNSGNSALEYNTMSTPRGGQYQLLLPDGSKVWLNAASSITYPVTFASNERRVTITGEAYFEVAKDKSKPFRVSADDVNIEVLGTHFNVNAYKDEGPVKTTLLEGSVKINKQIMKPGEAYMDGKIFLTNVEQDVAWKNGVFNFNDQNLSQIMLQLSRWYDLEVEFPSGVPKKQYGGEIGRNLNLSQVLKGLENTGVHLELQGRRLIVKP